MISLLFIDLNGIPETPAENCLIENLMGKTDKLIRMTDVKGFTLKNITIQSKDSTVLIDDGRNILFEQEMCIRDRNKLVGERKILTYGHANNATYAEGPHLYKINGKYLLLMAEGGSSYHHAVTVHQSKSLWGPYVADKTNPVLSHRHLRCV